MSDYEDKCKYYENLYKPKNSSSGSSGSGKTTTTTKTSGGSPSPSSSGSSTGSSSSVDSSAYAEMMEDRGQLQNLASETRSSKREYDADVDTLSTEIGKLDSSSIVLSKVIEELQAELSVDTYDGEYDSAINNVVNATP
ncbi:MAG: hypothetical protein J6U23_03855 [Clostridiales bacterium]|nr:hypothetical protein [Clostridiales bacterium]